MFLFFIGAIATNEATLADYDEAGYNDDDDHIDDDDGDDLDDVAIASLKDLKKDRIKRKVVSEEDSVKFSEILKQPNLKVKDFVK